jgi:5'-nucleotidase
LPAAVLSENFMDRSLSPDLPIVIGVSTRALFDLEEEHAVFVNDGVAAYTKLQRERERDLLKEGTAFEVIRRLLALNDADRRLVDVVVLSQNSPDLSLRAFNSFEHYGLPIRRGSFTSGRPVAPFVKAWNIDLFLSNDDKDVRDAVAGGTAAAKLGPPPCIQADSQTDEVRIVFDGDSVLFGEESDLIYREHGLERFLDHERDHATAPMKRGPFGNFLHKLAEVRRIFMGPDGVSRIRIGLVTARNAPAHARVIHTLRDWGTPVDEIHLVGATPKAAFLRAIGAHIFFDDQQKHVDGAAEVVPAGHVPGPHDPGALMIVAEA